MDANAVQTACGGRTDKLSVGLHAVVDFGKVLRARHHWSNFLVTLEANALVIVDRDPQSILKRWRVGHLGSMVSLTEPGGPQPQAAVAQDLELGAHLLYQVLFDDKPSQQTIATIKGCVHCLLHVRASLSSRCIYCHFAQWFRQCSALSNCFHPPVLQSAQGDCCSHT